MPRFNTFLLLLTLLSPSISAVICGARCVAAARTTTVATAASCHGQAAHDDRDGLGVGGVCHEQSTAVLTAVRIEPPRVAFVPQPAFDYALALPVGIRAALAAQRVAPPNPPHAAIPLRI